MVAMLLRSRDDGQGGRDASEYPAFGSSQTLVGQMPLLFWAKMPLFIDDFVRGGRQNCGFPEFALSQKNTQYMDVYF